MITRAERIVYILQKYGDFDMPYVHRIFKNKGDAQTALRDLQDAGAEGKIDKHIVEF